MTRYHGPERRNQLDTRELWLANITALNQANLTGCQMRCAIAQGEDLTFIIRFSRQIPRGNLNLQFPYLEEARVLEQGWQRLRLTLDVTDSRGLTVQVGGRFAKHGVSFDVDLEITRELGVRTGITADRIEYGQPEGGPRSKTTMADILQQKLKDGTRKFCRKGDVVRDLNVEGIIAIFARYLADASRRTAGARS